MQVYVPVTVPLAFDGGGLLLPVIEERASGEYRRHSGDWRSAERPSSFREPRRSGDYERRHRDREESEPRERSQRERGGRSRPRRSERSERSPRENESEQPEPQRQHSGRTEPPSDTHSITAHPGSPLGSRHTRHNRAPRSSRMNAESSRARSTRGEASTREATRDVEATRADEEAETRHRARLTLRWVRGLVPGLPPPGATPPLSPPVPHSPSPGYFYDQTGHTFVEPVRPAFRRQSSWGDYVRKLAPNIPNMGWRSPAPTPPAPAYQAQPVFYAEHRPPVPPKVYAAPQQPPPVPPSPKIYAQPEPARPRRRDRSPGRLLDSVAAAFRPRKVRFADGGQPGSSVVGG
jgi:hypothetical protein